MPHRPKWIEIGKSVTWECDAGKVTERILRITEPQPGNYVLWTTLGGKEHFGTLPADFPINYRQVKPVNHQPTPVHQGNEDSK